MNENIQSYLFLQGNAFFNPVKVELPVLLPANEVLPECRPVGADFRSLGEGTYCRRRKQGKAETGFLKLFPLFKRRESRKIVRLQGEYFRLDSSIFSQNAVTVVNFWFNGCTPCVEELPALNKLNEELKAKGAQVIGVNTDSLDGNKEGIAEAKSILKKQGADYTNLSLDSDSEVGKYATNIMAFPTTVLVDRNGNIVGDPIMGGITSDEVYKKVTAAIDQILEKDKQ